MPRKLVAGNWKMNLNSTQARELAASVAGEARRLPTGDRGVETVVCPAFVHLAAVVEAVGDSGVAVGAQDCFFEADGAFTGEVSAPMLADLGVRYVILGHSERRHTIGHLEDDRMIRLKTRSAMARGLVPILCVGETLSERDAGATLDVVSFQLHAGLFGLEVRSAASIVIAYEPVWAIGTGRTATPEQAQEVHAHIRSQLRRVCGDAADDVRVLYGGSVKPDNAVALFSQKDVDGGLIGGASLKADGFCAIVRAALPK